MSVPTSTLTTSDAVTADTVYEDLSPTVKMISPVDTIVFSKLGNTSNDVKNTKHEWLKDSLAAAASNAHVDGDDDTTEAVTLPTRLYNMHQIQKKTLQISGSVGVSDAPQKVHSEEYQTVKKTKELMKDHEYALMNGIRNDGGASTARQMRGIPNWITTNISKHGDATVLANGTISGGTARDLTAQMIKDVRQGCFVSGGNPNEAFCGPFQKRQVTRFSEAGNYRTQIEGKKFMTTIDVFVDEFGILKITPHRNMPNDIMLLLDMDYWKKAVYRSQRKYKLAKTGDNDKSTILSEWTVEACSEDSSGRIVNLTTA